jgi:hypothetical protein
MDAKEKTQPTCVLTLIFLPLFSLSLSSSSNRAFPLETISLCALVCLFMSYGFCWRTLKELRAIRRVLEIRRKCRVAPLSVSPFSFLLFDLCFFFFCDSVVPLCMRFVTVACFPLAWRDEGERRKTVWNGGRKRDTLSWRFFSCPTPLAFTFSLPFFLPSLSLFHTHTLSLGPAFTRLFRVVNRMPTMAFFSGRCFGRCLPIDRTAGLASRGLPTV